MGCTGSKAAGAEATAAPATAAAAPPQMAAEKKVEAGAPKAPAMPPHMSGVLTVKDDATVEEYTTLFWSHGSSTEINLRGEVLKVADTRASFCDESKSAIYVNTKKEKELMISLDNVDLAKMGALMGSAEFQKMGDTLFDFNPAEDMKLRGPDMPAAEKQDMSVWLTLKEGVTAEDYLKLFWAHADSKTLEYAGETYDMPMTRGDCCDESKTKVFQNTKNAAQLVICCFGADMAKIGELMGGPIFQKMGEKMWTMDKMEYLSAVPPPPPAAAGNPEHEAMLKKFGTNFSDAECCKTIVAEGFWFSPPGAPQFPLETFCGMMGGYKTVFPDWTHAVGAVTFVSEDETTATYTMETQQRIGKMQADLPEMGPFPACTLEEALDRIKTQDTVLPFEVGTYKVDKATGKLLSGDYTGVLGATADATTMDMDPPVGMVCLYKMLGKELPAPEA
ncbi:unnamed protein product [Amoebophrya sp. A25]|nr:unnamed protein product [Amoebophrya sp. A25]|eukprot:GSA25T00003746001.1